MTTEELHRAFDFMVATTAVSQPDLRDLFASLQRAFQSSASGEVSFQAIDWPIDGQKGGYAFLWGDVIAIGDLCEVLVEGLGGSLLPNQLASVVVTLLNGWQQLRRVRVKLDENEFKVLRAVRRGHSVKADIAKVTGLPITTVESTVAKLLGEIYSPNVYVLEIDQNGALITRF